MEILFLYQRLYHTARKQLDALRRLDLGTMETLTRERERITNQLCSVMQRYENDDEKELSPVVKRRMREFTAEILDIDGQIKETLLEELKERTLELSGLSKDRED